ncbi:MAG: WecB/TagA/CpsF family glycosyltransferase [Candidatus Eisenbacteria bacterium]|nr:WecB/TagA/CpsF family glycosyltransferase [Candidatus Eisenbacteria bacterium]
MNSSLLSIGTLQIDRVTMRQALQRIASLVHHSWGGYVVTPNVDHVVLAERDERLREAYRRANLSLADGMPLVWMSRLLGAPLPERVAGSDLFEPLMALAAREGWPVFFVGSTEANSVEACRRLTLQHPGLRIAGRDTGRWNPDGAEPAESAAVTQAIRESGARLVIVALGCPKQELWMAHHADALRPAVALGLGGVLDFTSGAVGRAPHWMRRSGLEWAYRLLQEPGRLAHRYLVQDMQVLPIFARQLWRGAEQPESGPATASRVPE